MKSCKIKINETNENIFKNIIIDLAQKEKNNNRGRGSDQGNTRLKHQGKIVKHQIQEPLMVPNKHEQREISSQQIIVKMSKIKAKK